jgi:hypothetical protein
MAADLGISGHTWYMWESAKQRIKAEHAMELVEKHGVTLAWVYYGTEPGQRGHVFAAETWDTIREAKQREKAAGGGNTAET